VIVYTDSIEYAEQVLSPGLSWKTVPPVSVNGEVEEVVASLFHADSIAVCTIDWNQIWNYLFIVKSAPESQYDTLIRLAQAEKRLPGSILCLAGSGSKLHGFKKRPWVSLAGNIHLSAFLAPGQKVDHFGVGFTILSAVSVVETVDSLEGLKGLASIKWVNDILIENTKVSGVLAHTQSQGEIVTGAVLGIGVNVESTPHVERDHFVPGVASLRDFLPDSNKCNQRLIFNKLAPCLDRNYRLLLSGEYHRLLDFYRQRSLVIGREVNVYPDAGGDTSKELASGRVVSIGENLELYLDSVKAPVSRGRLVVKS
jgi:biotin-(acetyl-CoA carboxylase) ligase